MVQPPPLVVNERLSVLSVDSASAATNMYAEAAPAPGGAVILMLLMVTVDEPPASCK